MRIFFKQMNFEVEFDRACQEVAQTHTIELSRLKTIVSDYRDMLGKALGDVFHVDSLHGMSLVDLGCGSVEGDTSTKRSFEPWLCRVLHTMGEVDLVGIDIGSLDSETFPHIQSDLTTLNPLKNLPRRFHEDGVDIITNFDFLDPKRLGYTSAKLRARHGDDKMPEIHGQLLRAIEALLKENGVYIQVDQIYQKRASDLYRVS